MDWQSAVRLVKEDAKLAKPHGDQLEDLKIFILHGTASFTRKGLLDWPEGLFSVTRARGLFLPLVFGCVEVMRVANVSPREICVIKYFPGQAHPIKLKPLDVNPEYNQEADVMNAVNERGGLKRVFLEPAGDGTSFNNLMYRNFRGSYDHVVVPLTIPVVQSLMRIAGTKSRAAPKGPSRSPRPADMPPAGLARDRSAISDASGGGRTAAADPVGGGEATSGVQGGGTVEDTASGIWVEMGRKAQVMFEVYDSGFAYPQWSVTKLASGELATHAERSVVYYRSTDDYSEVVRMAREREPVNIGMHRKYNEGKLMTHFGYSKGVYGNSTKDRLLPNIAIYCRTPVECRGKFVDANVINLIGYAFDSKDQPDYKYFFQGGVMSKDKWDDLVRRMQMMWRFAFQAAKDHGLKYVYLTGVGGGAFGTYLNHRPETHYNKLWEASVPPVEAEFPGIQRLQLGRIPMWIHSKELAPTLDESLLVNAWDPWSMVGNGNANDNSLDGYFGACTAMGVLCWPETNPKIRYAAVTEPLPTGSAGLAGSAAGSAGDSAGALGGDDGAECWGGERGGSDELPGGLSGCD